MASQPRNFDSICEVHVECECIASILASKYEAFSQQPRGLKWGEYYQLIGA